MSTLGHRLVPIRPSPQRGGPCQKGMTMLQSSPQSPLTPPQTGLKRKYEEDDDDDDDDDDSDTESCKRRIDFAMNYACSPQPVSISRRNARERNRVKQVNNGFAALRQHIPGAAKTKKISKVDTLKQALEYIQNLQMLLDENDKALNDNSSFLPFQMSSIAGLFQSSSGDLDTQNALYQLIDEAAGLKPPFFYDENISPNSTSAGQNMMSPTLSLDSLSQLSPCLSPYAALKSPLHNNVNTSSSQCMLTHESASLGLESPLPPNVTHSTSLSVPPSPVQKVSQFSFSEILSNSSNLPNIHRGIPITNHIPLPELGTIASSPETNTQVIKQHPQVVPTPLHQPPPGAGSISQYSPAQTVPYLSRTQTSNVPLASTQVYQRPVAHPSHHSLVMRPPNQTCIPLAKFQAETPSDLADCLPEDALSSTLPQLEASYSCAFETNLETIVESPYEDYNSSSSDSTMCKSPITSIANIDSVLSSNLMPSITSLIDVFKPIEGSSTDGGEDLLDVIDLWEKC